MNSETNMAKQMYTHRKHNSELQYVYMHFEPTSGFSPEMFVSVVKVYTNVHEARGEKM